MNKSTTSINCPNPNGLVCCCRSPKGASVSKHKAKHSAPPLPQQLISAQRSHLCLQQDRPHFCSSCDKDTNTLLRQKQLLHWCCSLFSTLFVKYRDNFQAKPLGKELYSKSLVLCLAQEEQRMQISFKKSSWQSIRKGWSPKVKLGSSKDKS